MTTTASRKNPFELLIAPGRYLELEINSTVFPFVFDDITIAPWWMVFRNCYTQPGMVNNCCLKFKQLLAWITQTELYVPWGTYGLRIDSVVGFAFGYSVYGKNTPCLICQSEQRSPASCFSWGWQRIQRSCQGFLRGGSFWQFQDGGAFVRNFGKKSTISLLTTLAHHFLLTCTLSKI